MNTQVLTTNHFAASRGMASTHFNIKREKLGRIYTESEFSHRVRGSSRNMNETMNKQIEANRKKLAKQAQDAKTNKTRAYKGNKNESLLREAMLATSFAVFCFFCGVMLFTTMFASDKTTTQTEQAALYNPNAVPIEPEVMKSIELNIRSKFQVGSWRFAGIEQFNGIAQVFIQTPRKLGFFDKNQHHTYVRQSVCPAPNDSLWHHVSPNQLNIHLYTEVKSQAVQTNCAA